jgi:hypothetical protein
MDCQTLYVYCLRLYCMQGLDHRLFVNYRRVVIEEYVCVTHYCFECIRLEDIGAKRSQFTGFLATMSKMSEVSLEQCGL